jgi:DNA-binding NarL/FixJ family response regulator
MTEKSAPTAPSDLLKTLLETLDLLTAQARAYERSLPGDNYPARAAVANLGELARQALAEAQALSAASQPAPPPAPAANPSPFSERELEVLHLVVDGQTNREIAYNLGISARTVQFHLNSIFNKTGVDSRTEAATLAMRKGWLAKPGQ